jgi:hypothetical protein
MSQINNSMLRLAQRAAYNPQRPNVSASVSWYPWKERKPASHHLQQTAQNTYSPKQHPTKYAKKPWSITYPTNSPSSAAPLSHPHPLPSLSPCPSHSYSSHCRRQKTKASNGGDGTKRSSSPALRQSCGGMGYRKPRMLKKRSGGSARIAWWGCGWWVWGLRRSFCFALFGFALYCSGLVCTGMVRVATSTSKVGML